MTNYQNDIMELLQGETPKQKYEFLVEILKMHKEHDSGIEATLLTVCDKLDKIGEEMFAKMGNIEKMIYIKWREEV